MRLDTVDGAIAIPGNGILFKNVHCVFDALGRHDAQFVVGTRGQNRKDLAVGVECVEQANLAVGLVVLEFVKGRRALVTPVVQVLGVPHNRVALCAQLNERHGEMRLDVLDCVNLRDHIVVKRIVRQIDRRRLFGGHRNGADGKHGRLAQQFGIIAQQITPGDDACVEFIIQRGIDGHFVGKERKVGEGKERKAGRWSFVLCGDNCIQNEIDCFNFFHCVCVNHAVNGKILVAPK